MKQCILRHAHNLTVHSLALYFVLMFVLPSSTFAQGNWTWMSGTAALNQPPQYGTSFNATNTPGHRITPATWMDQSGKMWLFGGHDGAVYYSDLWVYDPTLLQWKLIAGPVTTNQPGVYGTQGVATTSNWPGGRGSSGTWTDNNGDLWLFGGTGYNHTSSTGEMNDLWKYNIATNQWTWMHGTSNFNMSGTYGTQGIAAPGNMPSSRVFPAVFTHSSGTLWLYGGSGKGANFSIGPLMDLWKYDPATNQWAWMKGGQNTSSVSVSGAMGVFAPGNLPCSRVNATAWVDGNSNFWMYGGTPFSGTNLTTSELWTYDPSTNNWAWMGGTTNNNTPGVYGTMNIPSATTKPGPRTGAKGWTDAAGNLWLFGGVGMGTATAAIQPLSDVWRFIPSLGQWSWEKGPSSQLGTAMYGTQLVTTHTNTPGAYMHAGAWSSGGVFWLYSGWTYLNGPGTPTRVADMWKFEGCNAVPNPTVAPNIPVVLCGGTSITLLYPASSGNNVNWYSSQSSPTSIFTGTAYNTMAPVNTQTSTVSIFAEVFTPSCIVTQTMRTNYSFTAVPGVTLSTLSNPSVCKGKSLTLSATGASTINWMNASTPGPTCVVNPVVTTTYYVSGTNSFNCNDKDTVIVNVKPSPDLQYTVTPQHICAGENATLQLSGADTYSWAGGEWGATYTLVATPNTNYTTTGTFSSNSCSSTLNIGLVLEDCTGLNTLSNSAIVVFPNPFENKLEVIVSPQTGIEIMDVTGHVLFRQFAEQEKNTIDLGNTPSGVYLISLFKDGRVIGHKKLLKR